MQGNVDTWDFLSSGSGDQIYFTNAFLQGLEPEDVFPADNQQARWWSHLSWVIGRFASGPDVVVGAALLLRLFAVPLSLLQINPYSTADVVGFTQRATRIGTGFQNGEILIGALYRGGETTLISFFLGGGGATFSVSEYWALLISPFWVLPGPSIIYAHVGIALLGVLAVYNIYAIGRHYHSSAAGVLAALPVAVYPSYILIQSTLLREVAMIAGITTAAYLLICPSRRLPRPMSTVGAVIVLTVIAPLRPENIPLYLLTLAIGVVAMTLQHLDADWRTSGVIAVSAVVVIGIVGADLLQSAIDRLGRVHELRATGRTAYLTDVEFNTIAEAIQFGPIGVVYFLYSPMPWMIGTGPDVIIALQAIGNIVFTIAALWGIRYTFRRAPATTLTLSIGFLAAVGLYGIVGANVGTSVRHRQMFFWVVYLFGAIGVVQQLRS